MANIKSAKKRILVNKKKNEQNVKIKSSIKTEIKNLKTVASQDAQSAEKQLSSAFKKIDSAASKHLMHKNTANRRKAALAKAIDQAKKSK